ncbi:MAG: hypothetical protein H7236_18810, partial [Gemmatimonadaceae bacterium]|nr:hypothetical protein [Caulobacter sp.]
MTTFSPVEAALEGARMTRRKPLVVLAWAACYFAMLVMLGVVVAFAFGGSVRADLALLQRTNDLREWVDIVARRK